MLAAMVAAMAVLVYGLDQPRVSVGLELRSAIGGIGEIFYASPGEKYSAGASRPFPLKADNLWHTYQVVLPPSHIDRIRIDPGTGPGEVVVRDITVDDGRSRHQFTGTQLTGALGVTNQVERIGTSPEGLSLRSTGQDPYFELRLPTALGQRSLIGKAKIYGGVAAIAFVAWLILEALVHAVCVRLPSRESAGPTLSRLINALTDEAILRVNGQILLSFGVIVLSGVLYVGLSLNQSSIGWWENIYPYAPMNQAVDLGTAKRIRSDEWNVQTPWILNQVLNESPQHNPNIGAEHSPLIASVPVRGWIDFPQVKFAGFDLFGVERGVSWWWAYKTFGLIAAFLLLFLVLTRGDLTASWLGSAWIFGSSFTQWWFSSSLPEILIAFALGVTGAVYALFSGKRWMMVTGGVVVFFSGANLLLNLYPAFIVPLAYLGAAILLGLAVQRGIAGSVRVDWRFRASALSVAVLLLIGYSWLFATAAGASIDAMMQTEYPGRRIAASGGVPFTKVFYGFFEGFRLSEFTFPRLSSNASEASSFVILLPLVLLAVPLRYLTSRSNALILAISGAWLLTSAWVFFSLPAPVERLMQAGGWSLVTPKRAILALGVGSILACVVLFAKMRTASVGVYALEVRRMGIAVITTGIVAYGWGLHQVLGEFFTTRVLLAGVVASTLVGAGVLLGRTGFFLSGLLIFSMPTMTVNPLVSGISSITEKPVLKAAAAHSVRAGTKWAVVGDPTFAQGLKAHGLQVFGGTRFIPERKDFAVLDPANAYKRIWNRYAMIAIHSEPGLDAPKFVGRRADQYTLSLDVCGGALQALGVTHIAYAGTEPPEPDTRCLAPLADDTGSGVGLFELGPPVRR